jgi:hypothetical protein
MRHIRHYADEMYRRIVQKHELYQSHVDNEHAFLLHVLPKLLKRHPAEKHESVIKHIKELRMQKLHGLAALREHLHIFAQAKASGLKAHEEFDFLQQIYKEVQMLKEINQKIHNLIQGQRVRLIEIAVIFFTLLSFLSLHLIFKTVSTKTTTLATIPENYTFFSLTLSAVILLLLFFTIFRKPKLTQQ